MPLPAKLPLQESVKFLHGQSCLFQDMGKGGSLDRTVNGNGKLQCFRGSVLLQPDMAAFLPDDDPSVSLKCPDDLIIWQARNDGHTASSMISEFSGKT